MLPYIHIGTTEISTFSIFAIIGILVFLFSVWIKISKRDNADMEIFYLIPKLLLALGFGYCGALFFDAFFKIPQNGGLRISGIMFYGGAVTGFVALVIMLRLRKNKTSISTAEWLDILCVPFVLFHAFGRLGCFFGGCCYGRQTDSVFGVVFPDIPQSGIYHYGIKVFPTQLFEACGLFALAIILHHISTDKFSIYCILYAVMRFLLEFLRGDNRGSDIGIFSPSQLIALLVITCLTLMRISEYAGSSRDNRAFGGMRRTFCEKIDSAP